MKKVMLSVAAVVTTAGVWAQEKFEVKDFGDFKLHSYISADPLGDMNYIIEGQKGLVILEPAVFHENIREFTEYTTALGKPIEKVIANYHAGGFNAYDLNSIVMVEGMPEFEKGDIYSGMMQGFAQAFGETIDSRGHNETATIPLNSIQNWAGVSFAFSPGANSDFPAAAILIGGKVYYTHFAPAVAHFSPLQITGRAAIDAERVVLEKAKASGATTFIGGHGGGTADVTAVEFQIGYLKNMKELLQQESSAAGFASALIGAYPDLFGQENVAGLAEKLY